MIKNNIAQQNIPSGWVREVFNNRITLQYGAGLPKSKRLDGSFPVYGSNGVVDRHSEFLIKGPGIIVGRKGTIGAVTWSESDFWPIDTTYYIEKDSSLYLKWLYYKLQSLGLSKMNSASGTPGLNREEVYKLQIEIPSPVEQQKIVEILGTVDEDIAKTQEVIEATEKLKRGLMQQLFTRGIGHTKFKETRIGQIPEEWEVLELGKVCDVRDGTHSSPKYHEEGVPLITSKNLVDTTLDFENVSLISEVDFQEIERRSKVDDGDILFGMIGTIGNPVIVRKDRDFAIKNVALIKFTDSKMNNVFVLNYLKSTHTVKQFNQKKDGSTQKFIALGVIRQIMITVPSVTEQEEIAEILSAVDEKISVNKKLKDKLTLLKKGLMHDLLIGKVRTI